MPRTTSTGKSPSTKSSKPKQEKSPAQINSYIQNEITKLVELHGADRSALEAFALFVVDNHKKKEKVIKILKVKPLPLTQIKSAVYQYFSVKNTTELKKSGAFNMAVDGIDDLNLTVRSGWEQLYRKFVGILPEEENQEGYGCINGLNIFNYFKPWQVFGLDAKVANTQDIKKAYHGLSKSYHPDVPTTGDATIFDRLTTMYKSIIAEA
ncbi:molecular chaperone DnaJ [Chamaesiphon sp. OTE_75_metabat_556]|uniref:molecular chaperone DnaJ n=1 Tax=Chamaesiphon sp. OTE_75_metabat_556 TaxID=2964692 RepID=UPI002869F222|nr:molecular chaperone DnaJ [Chamaesiphon sp. OTE_75_metabat_556]